MEDIGFYQMFTPIHTAWLERRALHELKVTAANLDSIERHHPAARGSDLFKEYRRRAEAGLLRQKPGRKPIDITKIIMLWFAKGEIEREVEEIWRKRRAGECFHEYNGDSPKVQAANLIASEYWFHCTGRSLLNRITKERDRINTWPF